MTAIDLVLQIALGIAFSAWVVRRDMRSLSPERYARSWNDASFWSAVVAFGPLCIPVHFVRTRRTVVGAVVGLFWMVLGFVAISLIDEAVQLVVSAAS